MGIFPLRLTGLTILAFDSCDSLRLSGHASTVNKTDFALFQCKRARFTYRRSRAESFQKVMSIRLRDLG